MADEFILPQLPNYNCALVSPHSHHERGEVNFSFFSAYTLYIGHITPYSVYTQIIKSMDGVLLPQVAVAHIVRVIFCIHFVSHSQQCYGVREARYIHSLAHKHRTHSQEVTYFMIICCLVGASFYISARFIHLHLNALKWSIKYV